MTEREQRRAARMERGRERAQASRQPTRAELDAGAHLLHCDRQHRRSERCNDKLALQEGDEPLYPPGSK